MSSPYRKTIDAWRKAKARCQNPAHPKYNSYGGRGISFSIRWETFENFLLDMGLAPTGYTLGRIDNDLGYAPENCRWETPQQQALNRRSSSVSGVRGVQQISNNRWLSRGTLSGIVYLLYYGESFQDAVKARKDWEQTIMQEVLK